MKTIIINSSNYVANSGNQYIYNLPCSFKSMGGDQIGVSSVSIYNSTFNITSARGNNQITIKWNANTTTNYTFTIPNSYMSISDINYFIQQQCILNNLYMTANSGTQNVYFVELQVNSSQYSVSLNIYNLPTSAQATTLGYSIPSGASWTLPSSSQTPQFVFNDAFGYLIGQDGGTYPSVIQSTKQQFLSTISPVISPIDSYIFSCNLINSAYTIPSSVFFTLPLNATLGALVVSSPSEIVYNDVAPNIYNNIVIQIYDQQFNPLSLNDKEMTLTLSLKLANEITHNQK